VPAVGWETNGGIRAEEVRLMRRMGLKAQVAAHWSTWAVSRES